MTTTCPSPSPNTSLRVSRSRSNSARSAKRGFFRAVATVRIRPRFAAWRRAEFPRFDSCRGYGRGSAWRCGFSCSAALLTCKHVCEASFRKQLADDDGADGVDPSPAPFAFRHFAITPPDGFAGSRRAAGHGSIETTERYIAATHTGSGGWLITGSSTGPHIRQVGRARLASGSPISLAGIGIRTRTRRWSSFGLNFPGTARWRTLSIARSTEPATTGPGRVFCSLTMSVRL